MSALDKAKESLSPSERVIFDAVFLAEVEHRTGATRKEMLAAFDRITAHSDPAPILIDWLRLILGEKP